MYNIQDVTSALGRRFTTILVAIWETELPSCRSRHWAPRLFGGFSVRPEQVKSRMQNQLKVEGKANKYNRTIPSLATVVSEEGLAAVYK